MTPSARSGSRSSMATISGSAAKRSSTSAGCRRRRRRRRAAPTALASAAGHRPRCRRARPRSRRRARARGSGPGCCLGAGRSSARRAAIFASVAAPMPGTSRSLPAAAASRSSSAVRMPSVRPRSTMRCGPRPTRRPRPTSSGCTSPRARRSPRAGPSRPALAAVPRSRGRRRAAPAPAPAARARRPAPASRESARQHAGTRARCSCSLLRDRAARPSVSSRSAISALSGPAATAVVSMTDGDRRCSLPRQRSQAPAGACRGARSGPARRGDAGRRARRSEWDRPPVRRRAGHSRRCPTAFSTSPIRAAARVLPCATRWTQPSPPAPPRRSSSSTPTCPCATPRDLLALAGACRTAASPSRQPPTERPTRWRSRDDELFEPLYGPGQRRRATRRSRRPRSSTRRTSSTTSTPSPT